MMKTLLACLALLLASPALAEAPAAQPAPLLDALDVELDPIAYALGGYSVHAGLGHAAWRLDLGVFGLDVPETFHGNAGFDVRFDGLGAKLDCFPLADQTALFFGVEAAVARVRIKQQAQNVSDTFTQVNLGLRGGWRFDLGHGVFVAPWVGVGRAFAADQTLGGDTFETRALVIFPTVHAGYRFF